MVHVQTPAHGTGAAKAGVYTADTADWRLALLCAGAIFLYLAGDLAQPGLALDGTAYATVANGMAEGHGSFWAPAYYDEARSPFHSHPPLGFALQSVLFRATGGAFWTEKVLAAGLTASTLALMAAVLSRIGAGGATPWAWLLLAIMPVSTYTLKNNFLESMVTPVCLAATWFALGSADGSRRGLVRAAIAGVLTCAGFLIKGPVVLFTLAVPVLWRFGAADADARFVRPLVASVVASASFIAALAVLLGDPDARTGLAAYFDTQVRASLAGEWPIIHGRGYQAGQMALNLAPATAVTVALAWRHRAPVTAPVTRMLLIGAAATLPLLLSPRQFKHYLLPGLPYFAIGLAMLAHPHVSTRAHRRGLSIAVVAVALLIPARIATIEPEPNRSLRNARTIAALTAAPVIGFCQPSDRVMANLARYHDRRYRFPVDLDRPQRHAPPDGDAAIPVVCSDTVKAPPDLAVVPLEDNLNLWLPPDARTNQSRKPPT